MADSHFDLERFAAAVQGYGAVTQGWLSPAEVDVVPDAVELIALELAARFARDTLEERYFGWDRKNYQAAWQHHLERAKGQLSLAESYAKVKGRAEHLGIGDRQELGVDPSRR